MSRWRGHLNPLTVQAAARELERNAGELEIRDSRLVIHTPPISQHEIMGRALREAVEILLAAEDVIVQTAGKARK